MARWHARAAALASVSALVVAGAVVSASPAAAAGPNLLSNPGFRQRLGEPVGPVGYFRLHARAVDLVVAVGTVQLPPGDSGTGVCCGFYQEVSAVPGAEYVAKAYVNMTSGTAVQVYLDFRNLFGNRIGPEYATNKD